MLNATNNITDAFTQGTGKVTSKVSSYVFKVRGIPAKAFLLVSWLHIMTYRLLLLVASCPLYEKEATWLSKHPQVSGMTDLKAILILKS